MMSWIILCVVVGMAAYVRLAPSDPGRWNQGAELRQGAISGTQTLPGGIIWRQEVTEEMGAAKLRALKQVIEQTPRTTLLAGSVDQGKMTYITRSRVFGFPDYNTIGLYEAPDGSHYLEIYARLRFGKSDLGVNAQRVKSWVTTLEV